jgi:hypothetical protein
MAQFKNERIKRPVFSQTGLRQFQDFKAKERFTSWSQSAISDQLFLFFFLTWIFPLLFIFIYLVANLSQLPDLVPLFYSRVWGETQLAARYYLFLPAVGTLLLGIFNFGLAVNYHREDRVSSYLLSGTATLISFLTAITIFNIINLIK